MKVLIDTNVVLDLLLDREPFVADAAEVFARIERCQWQGYLCATTLTTIHYLVGREVGGQRVRVAVSKLLSLCEVAPVTRQVLEGALRLGFADFEDAVLHEAAKAVQADVILTRNQKDFKPATLPVVGPDELLGR